VEAIHRFQRCSTPEDIRGEQRETPEGQSLNRSQPSILRKNGDR
jgi:hypothetical protein